MADEKKIYGDYVNTPSPYAKSKDPGQGYATTKVPKEATPEQIEKWLRHLTDFETICFAFSEIFGKAIYNGMSTLAELYIGYRLKPFLEDKLVPKDDVFIDDTNRYHAYIEFLHEKNPDLDRNWDALLRKAVPDILIHNVELKEFYEIKPNSEKGREEGWGKIDKLNSNYSKSKCDLPYKEGEKFKYPYLPRSIEIGTAIVVVDRIAYPIQLSLGLKKEGGLILYDLCIGTNWKVIMLAKALESLLIAIFRLLKNMLTNNKEFLKKLKDSIEKEKEVEVPVAAFLVLAVGTILLIVTSEVTIPVFIIAEVVDFFTIGVTAEFARRAAMAQ